MNRCSAWQQPPKDYQAFGASAVEVPWYVVPAPTAQPFWPFEATPRHFSFFAAVAASTPAFVRGPASARVARAVLTAPARTNELTKFLADMDSPLEVASLGSARVH